MQEGFKQVGMAGAQGKATSQCSVTTSPQGCSQPVSILLQANEEIMRARYGGEQPVPLQRAGHTAGGLGEICAQTPGSSQSHFWCSLC